MKTKNSKSITPQVRFTLALNATWSVPTTQFSPKCTPATGSVMSRSVAKYLLQARNSYRSTDTCGM